VDESLGRFSCSAVDIHDFIDRPRCPGAEPAERVLDDPRDLTEADGACKETGDGDFIGRV
jgi:hypothetical protein